VRVKHNCRKRREYIKLGGKEFDLGNARNEPFLMFCLKGIGESVQKGYGKRLLRARVLQM